MNKPSRLKTNLPLISIVALALTGCSYFDTEHTIEVERSDTNITTTKDLVDSIPKGLKGDTENSRQTGEHLKNNDED